MNRHTPGVRIAVLAAAPVLALAACTSNPTGDETTITVASSDDSCSLSAASAPAGPVVFSVSNDGTRAAEFYVYGEDGTSIVSEVENIGPGTSRDLVVTLEPGVYVTACDAGQDDSEIRGDFTVTAGGEAAVPTGEHAEQLEAASTEYVAYVRGEVDALIAKTDAFASAVVEGRDDDARAMYADARVHWERIEPVAESFGDLDPRLDLREADLGPQELWTGWHHLEKILWPPVEGYAADQELREDLAARLVDDTAELAARVAADDFTFEAFQIGNGAKELLDEVASGKITGEEEVWSGTDLYDFAANVEGARKAFEVLTPAVAPRDPDLVDTLETRFTELEDLLATHGSIEAGFPAYSELTDDEILALSRAVEALSEPLALLTAAAVLV